MKTVKSSVPRNIRETPVREDHDYRVTGCLLRGRLVGYRVYNRAGNLILETPLQHGLKHGREFTWGDDGQLLLIEPYRNGNIHGTAKQFGSDGGVIGTYTLVHGTGYDVWRQQNEDNTVFVSEIHSLQNGVPHGYEWHFTSARQGLWQERHWSLGQRHGIERVWNGRGRLRRGYPKFYVSDQVVSRQRYCKLARADASLRRYRKEEDRPDRDFSAEIQRLLAS